jgi:amino acid transporter
MSLLIILLLAYLGIGCVLAYRDIDQIANSSEVKEYPKNDVRLAVTLALIAKVVLWPMFTYQ